MAFQLFVDPTAGARSAADNIMKGAGAIADRLKEEKQRRKDESKLFKANVTKAAALGLGKGETMAEAEADLSENYTPATIQGLLEGTMAATQQQQREAAIAASKAQTDATRQSIEFNDATEGVRKQSLQLGVQSKQEAIETSKVNRRQTKQAIKQSSQMFGITKKQAKRKVKLINEQIDSAIENRKKQERQLAVMEQNAAAAVGNAEAANIRAKTAAKEEARISRLSALDPSTLSEAKLKDGTVIPGLYVQPSTNKIIELGDAANDDPVTAELNRLRGALVKLEGQGQPGDADYLPPLADDQEVDVDGNFEDLSPISWPIFSIKNDTAGNVRRQIRAKIAELEGSSVPRFNPDAPRGSRITSP